MFKAESKHKVIIELNKDGYLIVSFKNQRKSLGICLTSNFNQDQESSTDFQIGEEIDVIVSK